MRRCIPIFLSLAFAPLLSGCPSTPTLQLPPSRIAWPSATATNSAPATPFAEPDESGVAGRIELTATSDISDWLAFAMANHPRLRAANAQLRAVLGEAQQAGTWPNPMLELIAESLRFDAGFFADTEVSVVLAQPLPIGGRTGAAVDAKLAAARTLAAQIDWLRWEIQREVLRHFVAVEIARRRAELAAERVKLATRRFEVTAQRVDAGELAAYFRNRAEVDLARAELEIAERNREIAEAEIALREAAGVGDFDAKSVAAVPRMSLGDLEALPDTVFVGGDDHPRLVVSRAAIEAAEAVKQAVSASAVPDLTVSAGWKFDAANDRHMMMAGIGFPLPLIERKQGESVAASARIDEARANADAARIQVSSALAAARQRLAEARARWRQYRETILPATERDIAAAASGFAAGDFSALDVVDAEQARVQALDAAIAAEADVWRAAVDVYVWLADPSAFNPFGLPVRKER